MSALTARLNAVKQQNEVKMYSPDGARFQEVALGMLDIKGSAAHQSIGKLVTMINNSQISYADAMAQYVSLLK